jgi:hypothetical protein
MCIPPFTQKSRDDEIRDHIFRKNIWPKIMRYAEPSGFKNFEYAESKMSGVRVPQESSVWMLCQIPDHDGTVRWVWLYFELSVGVLILWIKLLDFTLLTTNLYHKQYHRSAQTAIKYSVQWTVTMAIACLKSLAPYYKAWRHKTSRRQPPL